jgi:hypothetical protein
MPAKICNHRRPEDGARCLLNEHPDNPHHGYAYRVNPVIPAMEALVERLTKANDELMDLVNRTAYPLNSARLRGKAEGVRLARSYAEEALREVRRG